MNTFVDETTYPVEYSAGGINAFYLNGCDTAGHRPSYAICVNKIQASQRGQLKDCDCVGPIRGGSCVALRMRKEELEKGKAIYFIHRDRLQEHLDAKRLAEKPVVAEKSSKKQPMIFPAYVVAQQNAARVAAGMTPVESETKSSGKSSVIDSVDDTSYAEVITKAMVSAAPPEAIKPEVKKPVVNAVPPIPGESMIDLARRIKAQKSI